MIRYYCLVRKCGAEMESPDSMRGEAVKCPSCGARMHVPSESQKKPVNVGLAILAAVIGFSLSIILIMGLGSLLFDVLLISAGKYLIQALVLGTIAFGAFLTKLVYALLGRLGRKKHDGK